MPDRILGVAREGKNGELPQFVGGLPKSSIHMALIGCTTQIGKGIRCHG